MLSGLTIRKIKSFKTQFKTGDTYRKLNIHTSGAAFYWKLECCMQFVFSVNAIHFDFVLVAHCIFRRLATLRYIIDHNDEFIKQTNLKNAHFPSASYADA